MIPEGFITYVPKNPPFLSRIPFLGILFKRFNALDIISQLVGLLRRPLLKMVTIRENSIKTSTP